MPEPSVGDCRGLWRFQGELKLWCGIVDDTFPQQPYPCRYAFCIKSKSTAGTTHASEADSKRETGTPKHAAHG